MFDEILPDKFNAMEFRRKCDLRLSRRPKTFITIQLSSGEQTAEVIKENPKTLILRLPDGNRIKRKK